MENEKKKSASHSIGGKACWASKTAKEKKQAIQKMNEARIKAMRQNKEDAEAYRKLKLESLTHKP